jgi:hypothetical protein
MIMTNGQRINRVYQCHPITIFSAPKAFTNPHIAMIQRNAIQSWMHLGDQVQVLLMGEETGLAEAARELGVQLLTQVRRNAKGTPLISSMFELAQQHSESPYLACINADVMLLPDFLEVTRQVAAQAKDSWLLGSAGIWMCERIWILAGLG